VDDQVSELKWVKAQASAAGNCVEVADAGNGHVAVRNSRDPGTVLKVFTPGEWQAFVSGAKNGEFDRMGLA
jgi:hypothetical protein